MTGTTRVLIAALLTIAPAIGRAQQPPPSIPPAALQAPVLDEVSLVAQGWLLLSQASAVPAAERAREALQRVPNHAGALTLLIEAEIVRGGTISGLLEYERWLGERKFEEPLVLRRLARSVLKDHSAARDPVVKTAALRALAEDGDAAALGELNKAMASGDTAATRALAESGNPAAVRSLIDKLNAGLADPLGAFEALSKSGSPLAIKAALAHLQDPKPEIRGAAVDALGRLHARDAIDPVRVLLNDGSGFVHGRAALALVRLGDNAGMAYVQELAAGPSAHGRLLAAEALSEHPDEAWVTLVRSLTSASEPEVRLGAARLIASRDPELAQSVVTVLQSSDNPAIRDLASEAAVSAAGRDLTRLRALLHSASLVEQVGASTEILRLTR
jgi:HEAT repeat protein